MIIFYCYQQGADSFYASPMGKERVNSLIHRGTVSPQLCHAGKAPFSKEMFIQPALRHQTLPVHWTESP